MSHYGMHWEWRGFGRLTAELRAALQRLKPKFPEPQEVVDDYLWVPGCEINVKFRSKKDGDTLKFKHLDRTNEEFRAELWLEDSNEEYPLPVAPAVVRQMADALRLTIAPVERAISRLELIPLLETAGARAVSVTKRRRQYEYRAPNGITTIVEWAEITSPHQIDSVAVENEGDLGDSSTPTDVERAGRAVAIVRDVLGAAVLRQLSYLEALAIWANGRQIEHMGSLDLQRETV